MSIQRIRRALVIIFIIIIVVFVTSFLIGLTGKSFGDKIGVVEIDGVITDSTELLADIVKFREDDAIRGVILRINSPGGAVAPTQEIFREVQKLRGKKKVFVSMASVCASGGYYIAAAGERIYANPSTITGSIGVIMEQPVFEELMKKIGVQTNTLKAGEMKDTGSPFRKMRDDERVYLNSVLQDIHQQFIKDIAGARKMSTEIAAKLSDGRIYTGTQAKNLGLVDSIGSLYDALEDLQRVLNIKGKPVLVYGKKPFSFWRILAASLSKEITSRFVSEAFQYKYNP
jgi:protease IV